MSAKDPIQLILTIPRSSGKGEAGYFVYHPERKEILPKFTPLSWKRLEGYIRYSVVQYKDFVFFLGGYSKAKKKYSKQVLRYNFKTAEWYYCDKMRLPRADFQAFVFDGKIYCAGGKTTDNVLTCRVEAYEPVSSFWFEEQPLPSPCADYAVVSLESHYMVLLVGGLIPGSADNVYHCSNHLWRFSMQKSNNEYLDEELLWDNVLSGCFPSSAGIHGHRLVHDATMGRIYCIGGSNRVLNSSHSRIGSYLKSNLYGLYYFDIFVLKDVIKDIQKVRKPSAVGLVSEPDNTAETEVNVLSTILSDRTIWVRRDVPECRRLYCGATLIQNKIFLLGGTPVLQLLPDYTALVEHENSGTSLPNEKNGTELTDEVSSTENHSTITASVQQESMPSPCPAGYYDKKRKIWRPMFPMETMESCLKEIDCVSVTVKESSKDLKQDRLNWFLQWSLW